MLDSLNRQELSLDMWALSKLRLEPGDQWLDEYFDATEAQLTRFTLRVSQKHIFGDDTRIDLGGNLRYVAHHAAACCGLYHSRSFSSAIYLTAQQTTDCWPTGAVCRWDLAGSCHCGLCAGKAGPAASQHVAPALLCAAAEVQVGTVPQQDAADTGAIRLYCLWLKAAVRFHSQTWKSVGVLNLCAVTEPGQMCRLCHSGEGSYCC